MWTRRECLFGKCCYCLELKIGCIVIGLLLVTLNFFRTLVYLIRLDKVRVAPALQLLCALDTMVHALGSASGVCLLLGLYKMNLLFIKISLYLLLIFILMQAILEVVSFNYTGIDVPRQHLPTDKFTTLLASLILGVINLYFLNVIRSYYVFSYYGRARPVTYQHQSQQTRSCREPAPAPRDGSEARLIVLLDPAARDRRDQCLA